MLKRILPVPAVITTECEEKQKKQERKQYNSKREPIHSTSREKDDWSVLHHLPKGTKRLINNVLLSLRPLLGKSVREKVC